MQVLDDQLGTSPAVGTIARWLQEAAARAAELGTHSAFVMGQTMENIERIESACQFGRLAKRQYAFNNSVVDQVGRHLLETNAIAVRTMHEDMRRDVYPPPPPPPEPKKWKGIIPLAWEFLFGES